MTEWEKAQQGYLYDANNDVDLIIMRERCADLCYEYNQCKPSNVHQQKEIITKIMGKIEKDFKITAPFYCDYGCNISIGNKFYSNYNLTILDATKVCFGDNVFIGPNCVFSTSAHPIDVEQRNQGLEVALPIKVGNNVWIGANVVVLPGVSIGSNVVIGAGSIVNKDIPNGVVAVGNPCKVLRAITRKDQEKYSR